MVNEKRKCLFTTSLMGATIQDGERCNLCLFIVQKKKKRNIQSGKINKKKRKMFMSMHTITTMVCHWAPCIKKKKN